MSAAAAIPASTQQPFGTGPTRGRNSGPTAGPGADDSHVDHVHATSVVLEHLEGKITITFDKAIALTAMGRWGNAVAIARCLPLAAGIPLIFRFLWSDSVHLARDFDRTVWPLIEQAGLDPWTTRLARESLLGTTIKVGLAMHGYAAMARLPWRKDLTALGSSFTRVYDDIMDNFHRDQVDERLAELFRGGTFAAQSAMERLLLSLYRAIDTALARPRADPIHEVMLRLHRYQCESQIQLDPHVPIAEIRRITRGKGGLGVTALFALLRPAMSEREQEIHMEFGDVLQLLDDHHDAPLDRFNGVHTCATRQDSTLIELSQRIRQLRRQFADFYGSGRDRQLAAMLFVMLVGAALQQGKSTVAYRPKRQSQRRLLFGRAPNITPLDRPK